MHRPARRRLKRLLTTMALSSLLALPALGGQNYGVQGAGDGPCLTTNLVPGQWSLEAYDNAGQPCLTKPDADQTCDPSASWDWTVEGHLVITTAPGRSHAKVAIQLWAGNGGGSCYGGPNVVCDNPSTHYNMESPPPYKLDNPGTSMAIPFEMLFYEIWAGSPDPTNAYYANYSGFWLFAQSSQPAVCVQMHYHDWANVDEAN